MSLILVCRRYIPGEAWTNRVLAYARGFAEQGADVKLFYLIGDKKRNRYKINIPGVEVMDFWLRDGFLARRNRYISLLVNLFRCKRHIQPTDCVFLYGVESYIAKVVLKKTYNVYGEITEHPYKSGSDERAKLSRSRLELLTRLKGLFVISKSLKKYFVENGLSEDRIHISNMFVDTNRFEGIKQDKGEKYFAYCGIVSKYKDGVDVLIKAFSLFHKAYPSYKLYVIGRFGSEDDRKELYEMCISLSVKDSVVFTGQVSPKRMPELLSNAHVLMLARPNNLQSQYGFPTKLGEYLATGNPVIVTNVGEIGDYIKNLVNGVVVEPDNVEAFAEGMKWVIEHPVEAKEIGQSGKQLANSEFSYRTQSKNVLDIILNCSKL